jgi:hypothetical protein
LGHSGLLFSSFGFFGLSHEPTVQRSPDNLTLAVDYTRADFEAVVNSLYTTNEP